ncbi:MAG: DUF1311 domain-containing protein [Verrucomicrobia bacterium]|nr:DUF1311 domain-containing protein [Verrucomicrobiota bacterium]
MHPATPITALILLWALSSGIFGEDLKGPRRPGNWNPSLDATIARLEAELKDATGQQPMNYLSAEIAELKDAKLFVIYVRLMDHLGHKGRRELCNEQGEWLNARAKHSEESVDSVGGSAALLEYNTAEAEFTDKRIKILTKRLAAFENGQKQEAQQAGADQPATKPADKPVQKDKPTTPTSKDSPR